MEYSMEAAIEATRLEEQVFQENYSLANEFDKFKFQPEEKVLDAGCGTGVLSRYLVNKFKLTSVDGIDGSELRLKQANDFLKRDSINGVKFHLQDLSHIDSLFYDKYDTVICRYVLEHTEDPLAIMTQLKRTLKKGGRIIIIDLDGVFLNLYSNNKKLTKYMDELRIKIKFDLNIGRKLPSLMKSAGFTNIDWNAELLCCKENRLQEEKENTEKRFLALSHTYTNLFKTLKDFNEFQALYLEEMVKPENTLVFTKYICSGISLGT